jgi:hypothetical protein
MTIQLTEFLRIFIVDLLYLARSDIIFPATSMQLFADIRFRNLCSVVLRLTPAFRLGWHVRRIRKRTRPWLTNGNLSPNYYSSTDYLL